MSNANATSSDPRIEHTIGLFSTIYLGGIPAIITNDSAFLSFLTVLSAIEALAGFRYAGTLKAGQRFTTFIADYFPEPYKIHAERLWLFRCRMVHAFSPAGFALTHHHSEQHLRTARDTGNPVLNAEDFYAALVTAAQGYFAHVRSDTDVAARMIERIEDPKHGGPIGVGPIAVA